MSNWLDPVRRACDAASSPVTFFFRDDDAGWEDEKLYRLLDVMTYFAAPIAVAAIPMAIHARLAADLRALVTAPATVVSVHQHGFAHLNHEATGRKSEFGPSRSRDLQRQDLADGKQCLEDALGLPPSSMFTPPWNRCTAETAECLLELGFKLLSRDACAEPLKTGGLRELGVHLDWTGRHGARTGPSRWGDAIADAVAANTTVGVMLHHAVMSAEDRGLLAELLEVLASHPSARLRQMAAIASDSSAQS
jgi:predicted deacetylase